MSNPYSTKNSQQSFPQDTKSLFFLLGGIFACLLLAGGITFKVVGYTQLEKQKSQEIKLTLKEYQSMKRHFFMGHTEFADLTVAFSVLSASIDVMQNSKDKDIQNSVIRKRFEDSLSNISYLSRFAIGMNEVYYFPSQYLFFDEENPEAAIKYLDLGISDKRTHSNLSFLAGFITHIFLRDAKRAGEYYLETCRRGKNPPDWIPELAGKLLKNEDPINKDPVLYKKIEKMIENAFPRAKNFFIRNQERLRMLENTK